MTRRDGASAPKHTPGPWDFELIKEHSVRPTVASVGDYRVVRSGLGARGYYLHGQDEDDARLISAAPDLLEALKVQAFSEMANHMYGEAIARHGHSSDEAEFAWKTAMSAGLKAKELRDAAIAKAEGGAA